MDEKNAGEQPLAPDGREEEQVPGFLREAAEREPQYSDRLFQESYDALPEEDAEDEVVSPARPQAAPAPYVRQRPPRKTQPAISDDWDASEDPGSYAHDSNVTVRGGVLSGGADYRRARSGRSSMQQGRYGRYLEVPKGRRSIFASRERARRRKTLARLIIIVVVFAAVAIVIAWLASRIG